MADPTRLTFESKWTDPTTGVMWKFLLRYYPQSREVELVDAAKGRLFLKRTPLPDVTSDQLTLGGVVTVCGRQLRLVGYADAATAAAFQSRIERTLALIKPDGMSSFGDILSAITAAGFQISRLRLCQLAPSEAEAFYTVHRQQPFFPALVRFMSSGPIVAMELSGQGAVAAWRQVLGPTDSNLARQQAPGSIRARFGTDKTYNCCHGSDSPASAVAELAFFFGQAGAGGMQSGGGSGGPGRVQPLLEGSSLCLIKPHALREGRAGAIVSAIQAHGFLVTAAEAFCLGRQEATQFHEVYRGVVSPAEFEGMVAELSSGLCLALEVALPEGEGVPALEPLRTLCGPADPELARVVRPASLRAQYGSTAAKNAVHCTDLNEQEAQLELAFFFLHLWQCGAYSGALAKIDMQLADIGKLPGWYLFEPRLPDVKGYQNILI